MAFRKETSVRKIGEVTESDFVQLGLSTKPATSSIDPLTAMSVDLLTLQSSKMEGGAAHVKKVLFGELLANSRTFANEIILGGEE